MFDDWITKNVLIVDKYSKLTYTIIVLTLQEDSLISKKFWFVSQENGRAFRYDLLYCKDWELIEDFAYLFWLQHQLTEVKQFHNNNREVFQQFCLVGWEETLFKIENAQGANIKTILRF